MQEEVSHIVGAEGAARPNRDVLDVEMGWAIRADAGNRFGRLEKSME
jgi:hypothetical protein